MKKNEGNPAVAGMVGAAIGAAVGSAATVLLSDDQKRGEVVKTLKGFHKKAMKAADNLKTKAPELEATTEKIAQNARKVMDDAGEKVTKARRQTV